MNHISGTLIPCCVCGGEIHGVFADPSLISANGNHCAQCKKALERFEQKRKKLQESDAECKKEL